MDDVAESGPFLSLFIYELLAIDRWPQVRLNLFFYCNHLFNSHNTFPLQMVSIAMVCMPFIINNNLMKKHLRTDPSAHAQKQGFWNRNLTVAGC